MTFSTYFSPGVALQGGGGSGGGGAANLPISGNGATITASTPLINGTQTWNNVAVTFTGFLLNVTDTASNAASLLMDLQVGGASRFSVTKAGVGTFASFVFGSNFLTTTAGGRFYARSNTGGFSIGASDDVLLNRRAAANFQLGAADAAAPVAQTLSVQSVVAGTTDTAGANFTFDGSQGTGTGAGGSFVWRAAAAGSTGSAQNALASIMTLTSAAVLTLGGAATGRIVVGGGTTAGLSFSGRGTITASSDGVFFLQNSTGIDFNRLMFGGNGATAPAIKRSTTFLHAVLANDTGFCGFAAANVQAATAYTVATLPTTPGTGMIARVTDALAPAVGATVAAGGAAYALVNYNGANWTVIGV